jgi:hypothetical protein
VSTVKIGAFMKEREKQLKLTKHRNLIRLLGEDAQGAAPGEVLLVASLPHMGTDSSAIVGIPLLTAASRARLTFRHQLLTLKTLSLGCA